MLLSDVAASLASSVGGLQAGVANPLTSPLLPRVAFTLGGLLGSSVLALRLFVRPRLTASSLFVRWRTWLVIAPLFTLVVLAGPLPLALFAAALAVQGSREYATLAGLTGLDRAVLLIASAAAPAACLLVSFGTAWLLLVPLAASLPSLLTQDVERGLPRVSHLAFGLWYLPLSLTLLVVLDTAPGAGPALLLSLGLAVGLSDVGAFTIGRLCGRRPLAAALSPSKTWAGLVGNLAGAALGVLLLSDFLPPTVSWLGLALVVAVGAVWGDLLESLLKRSAGVKDTGAWLPGFGGLLDRLDSLLLVLPLVYVLVEAPR
jgi:phosphatidate cytidylyltransferase